MLPGGWPSTIKTSKNNWFNSFYNVKVEVCKEVNFAKQGEGLLQTELTNLVIIKNVLLKDCLYTLRHILLCVILLTGKTPYSGGPGDLWSAVTQF